MKAALRESFDKRIPVLESIADDTTQEAKDRIRAVEALGKHSDLAEDTGKDISTHPEARRFLAAVHTAITETCSPIVADKIRLRIEQLLAAPFGVTG